jgi:hypothetical protein
MFSQTKECRQARLRRKLVNNEINPIVDAVLTIVLLALSPFIWMFALIHDKLMFLFLNKTYIYNVSWEVSDIDVSNNILALEQCF